MTRKLTCLLLACGLALLAFAAEEELWSRTEPGDAYVTFRLPIERYADMDCQEQSWLHVCYADTGEPVALTSFAYSGCIFATVPMAEKDRPLEVRDGSYPLADYNYVVVRKDATEDSLIRKLADFMLTPAGQNCVSNAGYGPIIAE